MSLLKNSLKDLGVYGAGNFIMKISAFLGVITVTHFVSPSEYAIIGFLLSFLAFTRFLIPLEISQAVSVFFTDVKDELAKKEYFSTGLIFTFVINFIVLSFLIIIFEIFHKKFSFISYIDSKSLLIIALALLVDTLNYYSMNIIRWLGLARYYTFVAVMVSWLNLVLLYLFVAILHYGINGIFVAWLLSWSIGYLMYLIKTIMYYSVQFSVAKLFEMISFSFPLLMNNIPGYLSKMVDKYILLLLIGMTVVGIYTAAANIASMVSIVPAVIQTAIWPLVYKHCKNGNDSKEISNLLCLYMFIISILVFAFILICNPLVNILLNHKYLANKSILTVIPLLAINSFIGVFAIFFPGVTVVRKNYYNLIGTFCSLSCNVVFGLGLTYLYGLVGVAYALIISSLVQLSVDIYFSQKFHLIKFDVKQISFSFVFLIGLISSAWVFK